MGPPGAPLHGMSHGILQGVNPNPWIQVCLPSTVQTLSTWILGPTWKQASVQLDSILDNTSHDKWGHHQEASGGQGPQRLVGQPTNWVMPPGPASNRPKDLPEGQWDPLPSRWQVSRPTGGPHLESVHSHRPSSHLPCVVMPRLSI